MSIAPPRHSRKYPATRRRLNADHQKHKMCRLSRTRKSLNNAICAARKTPIRRLISPLTDTCHDSRLHAHGRISLSFNSFIMTMGRARPRHQAERPSIRQAWAKNGGAAERRATRRRLQAMPYRACHEPTAALYSLRDDATCHDDWADLFSMLKFLTSECQRAPAPLKRVDASQQLCHEKSLDIFAGLDFGRF